MRLRAWSHRTTRTSNISSSTAVRPIRRRKCWRAFDDARFLRLRLQSIFSGVAFLNGCFFRHDALAALNGFDERFRLIADKDLLLRAAARGFETVMTRHVIYEYGCHAGSLTMN